MGSGILKKSLTGNKFKQKKLTNNSKAIEDGDDGNDEEIAIEEPQQQQKQEEEKAENNNNEKKAVKIVDDKEDGSPQKRHVLDEICKDDLTQLISVLTMSMASQDEGDDDNNAPTKAKTTQKYISKLLNILESRSTDLDDNTKNSIMKNRYSLSGCDTSTNKDASEAGGDEQVQSLIESLKAYKPEENDDKSNAEITANVQKLASQLEDAVDVEKASQAEKAIGDNNNTNDDVAESPEVVTATKAVATLSPIETAWADENIQKEAPSSAKKKKKNYSLSPRKALKKKFVRFKEQLESPRSAASGNISEDNKPLELLYETVKMIIVTASIILKQSGFEEELIKLCASNRINSSNKPWLKLNKANAADKKDANINAKEVSALVISALCSGIGTIQATELAVQTLRSKGYKVTEKAPLPEGEIEDDTVLVMDPSPQDVIDNNDVEGEETPK